MVDEKPQPPKTPDTITLIDTLYAIPAASLISSNQTTVVRYKSDKGIKIDWKKSDDFTKSYNTALEAAKLAILSDQTLDKLLQKETWTLEDRQTWEANISDKIVVSMRSQPLFKEYRTNSKGVFNTNESLNGLTTGTEFDCTEMSIVLSTMMQRIDTTYLDKTAKKDSYKKTTNYFSASGYKYTENRSEAGGHNYVISEATACPIEATSKENPYRTNLDPNYTFSHFLAGYPIKTKADEQLNYSDIYTSGDFLGTKQQFDIAEKRLAAANAGEFDKLNDLVTPIRMTSDSYELHSTANAKEMGQYNKEQIANIRNPGKIQFPSSAELNNVAKVIQAGVNNGKTIAQGGLDSIIKSLRQNDVKISNYPGDTDFIIVKGVRFPVTFAKEVAEIDEGTIYNKKLEEIHDRLANIKDAILERNSTASVLDYLDMAKEDINLRYFSSASKSMGYIIEFYDSGFPKPEGETLYIREELIEIAQKFESLTGQKVKLPATAIETPKEKTNSIVENTDLVTAPPTTVNQQKSPTQNGISHP